MSLIDDNDRHQIYLGKLTTHLLRTSLYPSLAEAYRAASRIVSEAGDGGTVNIIKRIQRDIKKELDPILASGLDELTQGLDGMAVYEAGYSAKLFGAAAGAKLSVPAADKISSYVKRSILTTRSGQIVKSGVWSEYLLSNKDAVTGAINGVIAAGYDAGLSVGQIKRQIKDLTNGRLAEYAGTLARTGESHFQAQAREFMAADNADILKYRVAVATFDISTTLGCRNLHGRAWLMTDNSYVRFPRHYNCRTVYVFVREPEDAFKGARAAVGGKEAGSINKSRKLKYRGKKDKDIFDPGQISAKKTQDSWMKSQPNWYQDNALGPTRAKLLRDGKMNIGQFTDMTGKTITLDKLRELDADAFSRAGL